MIRYIQIFIAAIAGGLCVYNLSLGAFIAASFNAGTAIFTFGMALMSD